MMKVTKTKDQKMIDRRTDKNNISQKPLDHDVVGSQYFEAANAFPPVTLGSVWGVLNQKTEPEIQKCRRKQE